MSLNVGDVAAGIKLAIQIYEYGFVEENAAGRYRGCPDIVLNAS